MKTIRIKSLKLINFKGVRNLELNDIKDMMFIYGTNETGKTTIVDAPQWLINNKDSQGRSDFEVKTLDKNNNVIPKIDHVVEMNYIVSEDSFKGKYSKEINISKTLREKWVKKKGSLTSEFTGNESLYEWNGVPMKASEFTSKFHDEFIDEKIYRLITDPLAFNSLKWQSQRDVLIEMADDVDNIELLGTISTSENQTVIQKLQELFLQNKDVDSAKLLDEQKKRIKASILKSKKELETIPTRIDEVERSKPDCSSFKYDFNLLRTNLNVKDQEIQAINDQVSDKLKAQQADIDAQKELQNDIHAIETEVSGVKHQLQQQASTTYQRLLTKPREIQNKINGIDADIKANEAIIKNGEFRIGNYKKQISDFSKDLASLRAEWEAENAKAFKMDDGECACPTCKRDFDASILEDKRKDLKEHFISTKNAKLKALNEKGQKMSGQKMSIETNVAELENEVKAKQDANTTLWNNRADLSEELKEASTTKTEAEIYTNLISDKQDFFNLKSQEITTKKEALANRPKVDVSDLKDKIETLKSERDAINRDLQKESQIKTANQRIEALSTEEKQLAQAIADLEKELFTIEAFEKEKSTRIENSVNQKFKLVNFKLFDTQINGGEVPTCKALINGVPYSDANTASRINAGLDIINTLCEHYKAIAPIFIDNRESLVELIPTESQVINLIVSKPDTTLRVSDKPQTYAEFKNAFELETA